MISSRYLCSEVGNIWSEQAKFSLWLEIELAVMYAQVDLGVIPSFTKKSLPEGFIFDASKILAIEEVVKHDVIAFLSYISGILGIDISYMHYGMTSSDLVDTCLSVQSVRSIDLICLKLNKVIELTAVKALDNRDVFSVGRSHGIHAEPITFGSKFLRFNAELKRSLERLKAARSEIAICKMSGAMGNYANIKEEVEFRVANKFGLKSENVSSQVVPRDRHAFLFSVLGILASSIENIAVEIRSLQRTELSEVEEGFSKGQKGSSAMPHKRNPVLSENLTGLSRMVRSFVLPAMENIALWNERDISHSSVERCLFPSVFHLLSFSLGRLANILENLVINKDSIERNLKMSRGLIFSQRILLELVKCGLSRDDAYVIVQRNASKVLSSDALTFLEALSSDQEVLSYLSHFSLESLFDLSYYKSAFDPVYDKILSSSFV